MTNSLTAEQQYTEHQDAILDLLDQLRGDLGRHARDFDKTGRRHWGYPGDLAELRDRLQQAHAFMNNQE